MPQEQPQDRRVLMESLDASDVPSTRADKLTDEVSEPAAMRSLTRLSVRRSKSANGRIPIARDP